MAIRSSDQISIVDVTDAYSVILTSQAHTFAGSTTAAKAGTTTTQVFAMCGANQVAASVLVSEIVKPAGINVSVDTDPKAPTITIQATTSVKTGGIVKIPVHIGDITIQKEWSFSIAFTGADGADGQDGTSVSIQSTSVTYQAGTSGTTAPTGEWSTTVPTVEAGQYLWTRTQVTYSDGKSTTAYSVSRSGTNGEAGSSVTISSTSVTYQASTSGTETPSGSWSESIPSVNEGEYLWTKTVVNYSDGKSTTSYSVSRSGINGEAGADAITMTVTSSNGTIFKNSAISTVLTAHVYKAGVQISDPELSSLGSIKWYKDGGSEAVATGQTFTIDAGDVLNKATFIAQLEG